MTTHNHRTVNYDKDIQERINKIRGIVYSDVLDPDVVATPAWDKVS